MMYTNLPSRISVVLSLITLTTVSACQSASVKKDAVTSSAPAVVMDDTIHTLLSSPTTSKMYSMSITTTESGKTILLQDASMKKPQALLVGLDDVSLQPQNMDYRSHTLGVIRHSIQDGTAHDELWIYTQEGGRRLMQGTNMTVVLSPFGNEVASLSTTGLRVADVKTATTLRALSPADVFKDKLPNTALQLTLWGFSDDGSSVWLSANGKQTSVFARLNVALGTVQTYSLAQDMTVADAALNTNTGKIAVSDFSSAGSKKQKVTLSIVDLATGTQQKIAAGSGIALHPQWLTSDMLFIDQAKGGRVPVSVK